MFYRSLHTRWVIQHTDFYEILVQMYCYWLLIHLYRKFGSTLFLMSSLPPSPPKKIVEKLNHLLDITFHMQCGPQCIRVWIPQCECGREGHSQHRTILGKISRSGRMVPIVSYRLTAPTTVLSWNNSIWPFGDMCKWTGLCAMLIVIINIILH